LERKQPILKNNNKNQKTLQINIIDHYVVNVQFHKISIPTPGMVIGNSVGGLKSQNFQRKVGSETGISRGVEVQTKNLNFIQILAIHAHSSSVFHNLYIYWIII